jgi:hypothetical protein
MVPSRCSTVSSFEVAATVVQCTERRRENEQAAQKPPHTAFRFLALRQTLSVSRVSVTASTRPSLAAPDALRRLQACSASGNRPLTALRPRPRDFAKSNRYASAASGRFQ